MKRVQILLVLVLSIITAFATTYYTDAKYQSENAAPAASKETRLEQVKRSGTLRCGYQTWPPYLTKDPNTGKMGGFTYELVEEIGRQLKLKIDWIAEVATGQMLADLNLNRFDMVCSVLFESPSRSREGDFVGPLLYLPLNLYVRKDDTRFDQNREAANNPNIKFAVIDGDISSVAANEDFPEASNVSLPQLSNGADLFMTVQTGKADATEIDPDTFSNYNAANPDVLRAVGNPIRVEAIGMPIPANEPALKAMLNTTIDYLHDSGFIAKLMKKYEGSMRPLRVAKHFEE